MVQPHLKYHVQFWALQYEKDVKVLENILRTTKLVKGLAGMSYEEQLRVGLIALCNFSRRGSSDRGAGRFSLITNDRTGGNGIKLNQGKFRLKEKISLP